MLSWPYWPLKELHNALAFIEITYAAREIEKKYLIKRDPYLSNCLNNKNTCYFKLSKS